MLDADLEVVSVPLRVRLTLGRAAVQTVADSVGAYVLHIKGNAVDPELRAASAMGTDIDILVHPAHIDRLDDALRAHGWRVYSTYAWGSPFGHAQTYIHNVWGYTDLHRSFPGIRVSPTRAFERLLSGAHPLDFCGVACVVPGVVEQAAILMLNAARGGSGDLQQVWHGAAADRRRDIERVVDDLDARVAFSAVTGDLEKYRRERDYKLWKVISEGGSRSEEWRARVRAAPTIADAIRVIARVPLVNVEHLAHRLGRQPRPRDIVGEFFARPVRALAEALGAREKDVP